MEAMDITRAGSVFLWEKARLPLATGTYGNREYGDGNPQ
jgi:hypothetical protein